MRARFQRGKHLRVLSVNQASTARGRLVTTITTSVVEGPPTPQVTVALLKHHGYHSATTTTYWDC